MSILFKTTYFTIAIALLVIEISIAIYLDGGFIRHTFGDFLVVIMLYCFIKSLFDISSARLAILVLIIAFGIEFLQLWQLLDHLNLSHNRLAVLILGSTFEFTDLIAYSLGVITIYLIDTRTSSL